jgi:hypothetical protein
VEVRACRESRIPFNRYWPGRQRSLDQTERASYLAFEAEGTVSCSVKAKWACEKAVIRPLSAGIRPVVTNGVFRDIAVYAEHGVPNPGIDVTAHVKTENGANPFENIVFERFSINGKIVGWSEFSFKTNAPVRLRDEK